MDTIRTRPFGTACCLQSETPTITADSVCKAWSAPRASRSPPSSRLRQTARALSGVGGPCRRSLCVPAPVGLRLVRNVLAPLCACTWAAEVGSPVAPRRREKPQPRAHTRRELRDTDSAGTRAHGVRCRQQRCFSWQLVRAHAPWRRIAPRASALLEALVSARTHRKPCRMGAGSLGSVSLTGRVLAFPAAASLLSNRYDYSIALLSNRYEKSMALPLHPRILSRIQRIGESLGSRGHGPRA